MPFVQIIELTTTRLAEIEALLNEWLAKTEGRRSARDSVITKDRDRSNTYVQIVEFPSYEDAMANSALPETGFLAEQIAKLCDGPLSFRNLDVVRQDQM